MNRNSLKYFLLAALSFALMLVSCGNDNANDPDVVCLQCGDSTFWNQSYITVYDGETLGDAVKRMDSTYGTNAFSLCYLTMKGEFPTSDMPLIDTTGNLKLGGTLTHNTTIDTAVWRNIAGTGTILPATKISTLAPQKRDTIYIYRGTCIGNEDTIQGWNSGFYMIGDTLHYGTIIED